uniref:Uncharacterized protein n=2 Tax=Picea TaxID=3328 RepID=A0A101M3S7_PICGL|nr:hypothetical protein ABT39_MTgene230 [Picea glauca]QHR90106.1 hypothetical protein Q903MT_gene4129 [Picea sitchensis]
MSPQQRPILERTNLEVISLPVSSPHFLPSINLTLFSAFIGTTENREPQAPLQCRIMAGFPR